MRQIFCAIVVASLAACVDTKPPLATSIGPPPRAAFDPEPAIREALVPLMKDPMSIQLRRVGGPVPGMAQEPIIRGGNKMEGWAYCYMVNAKNSFGAYTGFQPMYFVFSGRVAIVGQNPQLSSWNCF